MKRKDVRIYHDRTEYYTIIGDSLRIWRKHQRKAGNYIKEVWSSRATKEIPSDAIIVAHCPPDVWKAIEKRG